MPTKIIFGKRSVEHVRNLIENRDCHVLLITTKSMRNLGVIDRISTLLDVNKITTRYVAPLPSPQDLDQITNTFDKECCNVVVGLGGGSVIDMAKSVSMMQGSSTSAAQYLNNKNNQIVRDIPLYIIPTTAGTGSEVTPWATLWDKSNKQKLSLEHESMFPDVAIVDPELTYTAPKNISAAAGMDALTQAIEAYWSNNSQPISDNFALKAIEYLSKHLENACNEGNIYSKNKVSQGSLMSGLAFSNTKTTICHSLSYPMTAHFGISHGQAVSITLTSFLEWNASSIKKKLPDLFEAFDCKSLETTITKIQTIMENIGLETKLSRLGISESDIELILKEGFYEGRADNNPKVVNEQETQSILLSIL